MDIESYQLFEHPWLIQNDIGNQSAAFANLRFYRIWRRQGFELSLTDEGNYLRLRNLGLITARARFGGRPTIGQAFAVSSNAQS
jgi:hypothetical protein